LIEKQENLIVLLEEKRQAVISHAVTKGLDPNAPMKDSGVEWLGEIPEHWEVKRLKNLAELNPHCNTSFLSASTEVTFLPMEYVKQGYYIQNTTLFSKNASSYNLFSEGDILIAKVTPCFENGNITIASKLVNNIGFGSSELFVIRCNHVNKNFMFYYLQEINFKLQGKRSMTGAGGLKRVSSDYIKNAYIPFPPIEEQENIVKYLNDKTKQFDELTSKAKSAIELMKERRTALISAAVTGKIDVRERRI
jgi:type I restriction enzyme S subunit